VESGRLVLRRRTDCVQGRLDAKTTFTTASLCRCFFGGGECEGAGGDGDRRDGCGTAERAEEEKAAE